MFDLDLFPKAK